MRARLGAWTAVALLCVAVAGPAAAQTAVGQTAAVPTTLRIITFNGGWNLPLWAGVRQGFFEANGVDVRVDYTPSSDVLIAGLADGRYDVAFATIDNFVAAQEGQLESPPTQATDFVAVLGGDGGFLSIVGSPSVHSVAELKGKTLSVDAMTNGLAFVLREILARNGVAETDVTFVRAGGTPNRYRDLIAGKHDASLMRTPFELMARERGLNVLATAESLGRYQGTVAAVRRSWARDHEAALVAFIRGYRRAVDWVLDPANRAVVEALLIANVRDMTPALAKLSCDILLAKDGGLARDAALDMAGIRTVLDLRTKYARPQKTLTEPSRYIDVSYYDKALAGAR